MKGMRMDSDLIAFETLLSARDALLAAQETARWTFWIMVATWVAGISTTAAVVVSLYLANRKPKPILYSSISGCILQPIGAGMKHGLVINVANAGSVPVQLSGIEWTFDSKNKIVQFFDNTHSDVFPRKLSTGESASYYLIFKNNDWANSFSKSISDHGGNIDKLAYNVKIGTGKAFKYKVDQETINLIKNSV